MVRALWCALLAAVVTALLISGFLWGGAPKWMKDFSTFAGAPGLIVAFKMPPGNGAYIAYAVVNWTMFFVGFLIVASIFALLGRRRTRRLQP
jgi:TRAP-type C4-dicarboxylate transport system permease small subunit